MSDKPQASISYRVMASNGTNWRELTVLNNRAVALEQAKDLLRRNNVAEVKIDEHFVDKVNDRTVSSTIFRQARRRAGALTWLLLAVMCGVATFVGIYVYVQMF